MGVGKRVPSDSLAALVPPDDGGYLYWRRGLLNKRKPMLGKIGWRGGKAAGGRGKEGKLPLGKIRQSGEGRISDAEEDKGGRERRGMGKERMEREWRRMGRKMVTTK